LGSLRDIIVHHRECMSECLTFHLFKRQDFSQIRGNRVGWEEIIDEICRGKLTGCNSFVVSSRTARSMVFSSSRTLLGKSYCVNNRKASAEAVCSAASYRGQSQAAAYPCKSLFENTIYMVRTAHHTLKAPGIKRTENE
jgi:hypothetical protein